MLCEADSMKRDSSKKRSKLICDILVCTLRWWLYWYCRVRSGEVATLWQWTQRIVLSGGEPMWLTPHIVLMYRCLHGMVPLYLMDSYTPTADVAGHQHLRSASQRKLIVPRYRLNSYGRRCFAVAGPSTWNSLPDSLRDPALSLNIFRCQLKTHFFAKYLRDVLSALEIFWECAI